MIGKKIRGFTLIEMIMVITMFAIIIVFAFDALGNIAIFRTRLSNRLDIEQDLYYSMETISSVIKDFGGDIDYEEYWDRQMMGTATASGHYSVYTGYGNYGSGGIPGNDSYGYGQYYCRSGDGISMGTLGCAGTGTINNVGVSMIGQPQRYGEYALQFIDYNSNMNNDNNGTACTTPSGGTGTGQLGDENCDGNIRGDDDDLSLLKGPEAFTGNKAEELYLVRTGLKNERMLFRLDIIKDPEAPAGVNCNFPAGTGSGCLGKIQILKLVGNDFGMDHDPATADSDGSQSDGNIDTWGCDKDFYCPRKFNIPWSEEGWVDLLPSYINVKNIEFYIYPKKDYKLALAENNSDISLNPYVRINITLGYSRNRKKVMKGINPEINLTTTINLTKK